MLEENVAKELQECRSKRRHGVKRTLAALALPLALWAYSSGGQEQFSRMQDFLLGTKREAREVENRAVESTLASQEYLYRPARLESRSGRSSGRKATSSHTLEGFLLSPDVISSVLEGTAQDNPVVPLLRVFRYHAALHAFAERLPHFSEADLASVALVESSGDPSKVSSAGAYGLMQIVPDVNKAVCSLAGFEGGVRASYHDPGNSIACAGLLLEEFYKRTPLDESLIRRWCADKERVEMRMMLSRKEQAILQYHGLGCSRGADPRYVEKVTAARGEVEELLSVANDVGALNTYLRDRGVPFEVLVENGVPHAYEVPFRVAGTAGDGRKWRFERVLRRGDSPWSLARAFREAYPHLSVEGREGVPLLVDGKGRERNAQALREGERVFFVAYQRE
ncbi:hypothetical protein D6783_04055 [Candidatus Woesearchaeota archaeon]|nr:MAG: hypothetical protein D6783_04055 [Candidatus Woesearchaeota archaeon]